MKVVNTSSKRPRSYKPRNIEEKFKNKLLHCGNRNKIKECQDQFLENISPKSKFQGFATTNPHLDTDSKFVVGFFVRLFLEEIRSKNCERKRNAYNVTSGNQSIIKLSQLTQSARPHQWSRL